MSKKQSTAVKKMNPLVDELGKLHVKISRLQEQEEELKQQLIDSGVEEADGMLYHVKVIRSDVKKVNYKGLIKVLEPSKRMLGRFTKFEERIQVRVSAR